MVDADMAPMQAIVAATRSGADYLGLKGAGTLTAGKQADVLVLDASPLDNITNSRRIGRIVVKGREVNRDSLRPGATRSNGETQAHALDTRGPSL